MGFGPDMGKVRQLDLGCGFYNKNDNNTNNNNNKNKNNNSHCHTILPLAQDLLVWGVKS